ncbi:MAG: alpha-amylase family protein [Desulfosoma sp.]
MNIFSSRCEEKTEKPVKRGQMLVAIALWSMLGVLYTKTEVGFAADPSCFELSSPVPHIVQHPDWRRFKILVWPFQTDVLDDFPLYQELGLGGFQIDRGAKEERKVQLSLERQFPYYVGHVAGKGFLYLTGKNRAEVIGKKELSVRPHSLADPKTIQAMREVMRENIEVTRHGFVLAYALDDEISLGSFSSPCDVDLHPLSLAWFREWLKTKYPNIEALNNQWGTNYAKFDDVLPRSFEQVRAQVAQTPIWAWNLSAWMDFRQFMDVQFACVLRDLVGYANVLDPKTPTGFVGGQAPSPWGGYDYALLSRAVQWMEAYDIHGADELLRSWWNEPRKLRMHTFFSTGNLKLDSWFLWRTLVHGNQAVVAWPKGWFHVEDSQIAPYVRQLKDLFMEIQGPVSEPFVSPNSRFEPDPIGIYYSHPSVQVGWAMDAETHGKSWPLRKGSIDNENQTLGVLRKVWCKTLEDLGYQYDFVSYMDVLDGRINLSERFKVIVLPRVMSLSEKEAKELRQFVERGGVLIADALCGVLDEHGKGRFRGLLDDLFGITRDWNLGVLNGKGVTEIDGERYKEPFLKRLGNYAGALRYEGIVVYERGIHHLKEQKAIVVHDPVDPLRKASVFVSSPYGQGKAFYLNLTPVEYWAPERRFGTFGRTWRALVRGILQEAGLEPRVSVYENGSSVHMIESLFWKKGSRIYLALVKNPTAEPDKPRFKVYDQAEGVTGNPVTVRMKFANKVHLLDLRSNRDLGLDSCFDIQFKPWEASVFEITREVIE